jgi:hypothetical protein
MKINYNLFCCEIIPPFWGIALLLLKHGTMKIITRCNRYMLCFPAPKFYLGACRCLTSATDLLHEYQPLRRNEGSGF